MSPETKWWPVFRHYVGIYAGRVAGMGGDPTIILPTGDGDWKHPGKWQHGDHDESGDSRGDHCHEHVYCTDHDRALTDSVTGKVVALRYDHFGDFSGFVVETAHDGHVVVLSDERRVEVLVRQAWVSRSIIRVRLLKDHRIETLEIAGQVDE